MDLLSNTVFQFIIASSISIILAIIGFRLTVRQPIKFYIHYEPLVEELVGSVEEAITIKEKMQVSVLDSAVENPCLVTFKVSNSGTESIELPETTEPLTIAFGRKARILGLDVLEKVPNIINVSPKLEEEKVLLTVPLLDPKESITLKVLVTQYVNYFPEVYVRVAGKKRIVKASNVRTANEDRIAAFVYFCVAALFPLFMFSLFGPFSYGHSFDAIFTFASLNVALLLASIYLFASSFVLKKMSPYPFMLHSELIVWFFKMFLSSIPFLIIVGLISYGIYTWFGSKVLTFIWLIFICLFGFLVLVREFSLLYNFIVKWFVKRQKVYNKPLMLVLMSLVPVTFLALSVCVLTMILINW